MGRLLSDTHSNNTVFLNLKTNYMYKTNLYLNFKLDSSCRVRYEKNYATQMQIKLNIDLLVLN